MMDERKYKPMSHTLDYINANFISIKKEDRTRYSEILIDVLNQFKNKMMKVNTLYNALNDGDIIYAGSTYDNIKVGKPNEFDLNVPLKLPINYKTELMIENVNKEPGFTKVVFTSEGWERLQKHNNWTIYSKMLGWVNEERQLLQDKFLQWMQGVVISTIEEIKKESKNPIPVIVTKTNKSIEITSTTSGPALTLHLKYQDILIDVDLVPVIRFNNSPEENHWPKSPVKPLPSKCIKRTFVAVPKPKRNSNGGAIIPKNPSWRLSFHEQEYELLAGTGELKNCLRQIKKLRDNNPHLKCVASYWIKTLFIWENENPGNADLWRKPKGVIFMHMLNKFLEYIKVGKIPFYWDPNHNLLSPINKNKLNGIREVLQGIITKIDKNVEGNPAYIAEILLNAEELARFKEGYVPVASSTGTINGNLAGRLGSLQIPNSKPPQVVVKESQENESRCTVQ